MKKVRFLVAATFGFAASCVLAEVQVVDRPVNGQTSPVPQSGNATERSAQFPVVTTTTVDSSVEASPQANSSVASAPSAKPNPAAEMFYQMQVMQQELLELRGLLEEQSHQIKQLKQQRLDDYVDLDRRLSSLSVGGAPEGGSAASGVQDRPQAISSGSSNNSLPVNDENAHYQSAIDPIIGKVKNLDLAISLLHEHLERFPGGQFAGNAKYWLGESYLVKDNIAESRKWFESLLNEYPLHGKVPAAKYKLGIVYHKLGMNAQAKVMLEEVRDTGGPAADRAADYLEANL